MRNQNIFLLKIFQVNYIFFQILPVTTNKLMVTQKKKKEMSISVDSFGIKYFSSFVYLFRNKQKSTYDILYVMH